MINEICHTLGSDQQFGNVNSEGTLDIVRDLAFADDLAIFGMDAYQLQIIMQIYYSVFLKFGLTMAITKTEVMYYRNTIEAKMRDPDTNKFIIDDPQISFKDEEGNPICDKKEKPLFFKLLKASNI